VEGLLYVETTIPSFYHETRTTAAVISRRNWTREWWEECRSDFDLVTAPPVLQELRRTPASKRERALEMMQEIRLLDPLPVIDEIITQYLAHRLMPQDAYGDAAHLAFASFYACDYLLTWNCKHLANGRKLRHIQNVNSRLGLKTPALLTPLELLER
jgi:predicted nucleic acid-binding protein